MASWLGQAFKTFLNSDLSSTKVVEIKQEKYTDRVVISREDGLVLYEPAKTSNKSQAVYEILLLLPGSESAYSIYRILNYDESVHKFNLFKDNLLGALNLSKEICNIAGVQKICDTLHENPSWTLAHIALQLNLLDSLSKPELKSILNVPDPTDGLYPIHLAIKNLNLQAIKQLLSENVSIESTDFEGNTIYHYAAETNKDIITTLAEMDKKYLNYRNARGHTPLHVACLADKRDCVKAFLLVGADVNVASAPIGSHTPVSSTSARNVGQVVKTYDSKLNEEDMKHGGTPLHWAESREIIEDLVVHKCDLNALNFNRRTALHIMVWRERLECAVALLSHGCEVNIQDQDGDTALHLAARKKNIPILQALVIFGADTNITNNKKETARHLLSIQTGDQAKKALYILHAVGALRCNESMDNCTRGCSAIGSDNGIPPPEPRSCPARSILGAYEENKKSNKYGDRVLCLDGGGIRGMVLISVLLCIEETANFPIIHCFDWIAGTSTGAILAAALASGKTLLECLHLYFQMKENIFNGSRPYASETLESLLKELFGEAVMTDIHHPKLILTGLAANYKPSDLHLFRNYTPPEDLAFPDRAPCLDYGQCPRPNQLPVWKAARASGAAPSYFRMFDKYLDGGLIANNPTLDVLTEIHEYNLALKVANKKEEIKELSVLVSVGTGCIPVSEIKDIDVFRPESVMDGIKLVRGISALGTLLVDQATLSDGRVVERARAWCDTIGVSFFRFSPQLSEEIAMDEKDDNKLVKILWETKVYMMQHQDDVNRLCELLVR